MTMSLSTEKSKRDERVHEVEGEKKLYFDTAGAGELVGAGAESKN